MLCQGARFQHGCGLSLSLSLCRPLSLSVARSLGLPVNVGSKLPFRASFGTPATRPSWTRATQRSCTARAVKRPKAAHAQLHNPLFPSMWHPAAMVLAKSKPIKPQASIPHPASKKSLLRLSGLVNHPVFACFN